MPPDETQTDGGASNGQGDQGGAKPADERANAGILADLKRERAARQAAETEAKTLREAADKASREQAEKAGEFQKLYEGLKPQYDDLTAKYNALTKRETDRLEAVAKRNTERRDALPENLRGLVPEGLDADATTAQIERLEALAKGQTFAAGTGAGAGSGGAKKPTIPQEAREYAIRLGKKTDDEIEKFFPSWLHTQEGKAWKAKQSG